MNILYISHLTNIKAEGPNNSVPAQISAQSKFDNVFWWNLTDAEQEHWLETGLFHGINEYPHKDFKDLPVPFDNPDLVIFESFYYIDDVKLARLCRKRKIPYLVIPRSALTKTGQKRKWYKKIVANLLLFKPMTKGAAAIQYLTIKEQADSGLKWNRESFVIPNGINIPSLHKHYGKESTLHGVYIGRMEPYQKGLDMLVEVCVQLKDKLTECEFTIDLHGPERFGCRKALKEEIEKKHLDTILKVKDGVFGKEKENVLLNADFFIMTSRFEGHPMALIEALSYGLPCFITQGSNMNEEVLKFDAGWVCENNVDSIRNQLLIMIENKGKMPNKGLNALRLAKEYNWETIAENSHHQYSKVLGRKKENDN